MNVEQFITSADILAILPLLIVATGGSLLLVLDLWVPKQLKAITGWLAAGTLITALIVVITQGPLTLPALGLTQTALTTTAFNNMVVIDGMAYAFTLLSLLTGLAGILLALAAFPRFKFDRWVGEYYVLMLFTVCGMLLLTTANDLIVIFIGIELLSIPLYILSGFFRPRVESEESAMKYFLLGAFSSGFLVYGIALTYGATYTTSLPGIATIINAVLNVTGELNVLLLMGLGLMLVGLGFKVAAVPFHMWTPDVYEGAPTIVTAFMSVGAKTAGFAALLRVFYTAFPAAFTAWAPIMAVLAALTMLVGNIFAVAQVNVKRMLAYSAIAHAGYILMAFVAGGAFASQAASSAFTYLVAYAIANLGAWAVVSVLETAPGEGNRIDDFCGLGQRRPGLALAMTIFMLSLTGIPLTVGFLGKFVVFTVAIQAGYLWLAIIGVLTSVISAWYYLRIIINMWMRPGPTTALDAPGGMRFTALTTGLLALLLGIIPGLILNFADLVMAGMF